MKKLFSKNNHKKTTKCESKLAQENVYEEIGVRKPKKFHYNGSPTCEPSIKPSRPLPVHPDEKEGVYIIPEQHTKYDAHVESNPPENQVKDQRSLSLSNPTYLELDGARPGTANENEYLTPQLRQPPSPTGVQLYPCLYPVNEEMRELKSRLQTFSGKPDWPAYKFEATTQEFAMAGLYYLDFEDRTSCWYCGGSLENWDNDDIPWEEHARWYPRCEFLLKCKGSNYVEDVKNKHK